MRKLSLVILLLLPLVSICAFAAEPILFPVLTNPLDKASLQRGAKLYINYCIGCHSLKYLRYQQLAADLAVVDTEGNVLTQLVNQSLIMNSSKISDVMKTAMPAAEAKRWFGVPPPDLSLIARAKGAEWVYTYLKSFYRDPGQPWGVNNSLAPGTAMPNVLVGLQGVQLPIYKNGRINHLKLIEQGSLTSEQFNAALVDIVNFLLYVSEPSRAEREKIGWGVLLYLVIMVGLIYILRKNGE